MGSTSEVIVSEIIEHVSGKGKKAASFYVGISNDPTERLFIQHNVSEDGGCWIYKSALDIDHARNAEKILLQRGMKGGDGGGNIDSTYVYCYMITSMTKQ